MSIYDEIKAERIGQDVEWGGPDHDDTHGIEDWVAIIDEHLRRALSRNDDAAATAARYQIVRVAALAVAAIESFDRVGEWGGLKMRRGGKELRPPNAVTLAEISVEVSEARAKFPSPRHLCVALMEEVGELAKALLESDDWEDVRSEAKQVACVAIRIMEEGDSDFSIGEDD